MPEIESSLFLVFTRRLDRLQVPYMLTGSIGSYKPVGPLDAGRLAKIFPEILPGFHPPQSWRYLDGDMLAAIRTTGRFLV